MSLDGIKLAACTRIVRVLVAVAISGKEACLEPFQSVFES
jgi:hypothetical protein